MNENSLLRIFKVILLFIYSEKGRFKEAIPAGQFEFGFEFLLPASGIPNSFEGGPFGSIRYIVHAEIQRPIFRFNYRTSLAINVVDPYDVILHLELMLPVGGTAEKQVCCFCCRSGPLSVSAYVEKQGNSPGGQIIFIAQFQNLTTRKVKPSVTLVQHVTFFAQGHSKSASYIWRLHTGNVIGPKESVDWDQIVLQVPTVYSTFIDCPLIRNVYFLRLTLDIVGARNLTIDFPIVIGIIESPTQTARDTTHLDSAPPSYQFLYPAAPTMADLSPEYQPPPYDEKAEDEVNLND